MTPRIAAALLGAWLGAAAPLATPAFAAEAVRELHGSADAFGAPGVAIAWAVLRGADEAGTVVTIRVTADPARYASIEATGVDPFTQQRTPIHAPTPTTSPVDLCVPRARFADFPRTEFRFHAAGGAPDLVVYFAGVPDTTPEFVSRAELDSYIAARVARLNAEGARR